MQLEIITPEKKIYQGNVDMVNIPGSDGYFGILENHAPIISTLKEGVQQTCKKLRFPQKWLLPL